MKKQLPLMLLLAAFSTSAVAQSVYFKAGGGYGMPIATEVIGEKFITKSITKGNDYSYSSTKESVSASYGAGINFTVGGGYMFNEYLGAELNVQYTQGTKFETSDIYVYTYDDVSVSDNRTTQHFSKAVYINPSFIITPGAGTKVPYGRFGVIAGSPTIKEEYSRYDDTDGVTEETRKGEFKKGVSFGFQGAVGMNWMLGDKIDLFTEINFISMTYYADEYNVTESTYNGNDNLPNMYEYEKKTLFKKEINVESEPDVNKPREELRVGQAFSSLSFQVGISFLLNGHGEN